MSPERFELLCRDGRRVPVSEFRQCNWGIIPSDAIVTSSARNALERKKYQKFLKKIVELYSDGFKDDSQTQGLTGNRGNNYNNDNNYGRNNPYDNNYNSNPYDPYNRNRFSNNGRSDRLDSSFTTERTEIFNDSIQYETFRIFESERYGKTNLLFQVS